MPSVSNMRHGGDLDEATRLFGEPPQGWLDLSTGINPRPYPIRDAGRLHASLHRLPTPRQLDELLRSARRAYAVPDGVGILAAPGTEVMIRMLPAYCPEPVTLIRTSYRSYGEIWPEGALTRVCEPVDADERTEHSIVVVNPNNPDGRTSDPLTLLRIARGRAPGRLVVIDEAYADCDPAASVIPVMRPDDPILVLRSFGKFYGLPGLRLGFAVGANALIARLVAGLGDWPISGPALAVATSALSDDSWRKQTRHWLGNQAQALDSVLLSGGLKIAGGCALFRAALADDAPALHPRLARRGIWTRIFEDWPGLIRFGLPPDAVGLARLADALASR